MLLVSIKTKPDSKNSNHYLIFEAINSKDNNYWKKFAREFPLFKMDLSLLR